MSGEPPRPFIPDHVRAEPASFDSYAGLVAANACHITGRDWRPCHNAMCSAWGDDLRNVGEWADLTVELVRRNLLTG